MPLMDDDDMKRIEGMLQKALDQLTALDEKVSILDEKVSILDEKVSILDEKVSRGFCEDADALAKAVTVAINASSANDYIRGHGILVCAGTGLQNGIFYLISAAHVIVEILSNTDDCTLLLKWTDGSFMTVRQKEIYLDKRYILRGTHDVGVMAVVCDKIDEKSPQETLKVKCCQEHRIGQVAIGHGLIYLNGRILHDLEDSPRALVNAISVPGCSGCPLFAHDNSDDGLGAALFAFLHGESKHRHSRVAVENASNHLYADKLLPQKFKLKLVVNDPKVHLALKAAENLSFTSELELSEKHMVSSENCSPVIRGIYEALFPSSDPPASSLMHSVNSIMEVLAESALVDDVGDQLGDTLFDGNGMLRCLVPRAPKKSMEKPVVSPAKGGN